MRRLAVYLMVVFLCGCNTMDISTEYDKSSDFSTLQTFDWIPNPPALPNSPLINPPLLDSQIRNAVESELSTLGYAKVSEVDPDFLVQYHAAIEKQIDVIELDNFYLRDPHNRYHSGWGSPHLQRHVFQYDVGSLILDIFDTKTKKVIWRGSAQAEVNTNISPGERKLRINKAVGEMLAEFPISK